jgi:hypothetical protein
LIGWTVLKTSIVSVISLHIFATIIALVAIIRNQRDVAKEAIRALACSGGPNVSVSLHRNDTRSLLSYHSRRLQKLKEQKACMGINTPPEVLIEIEDIEAKIEK